MNVMDKVLPTDHGEIAEGGISRPQLTAVLYSIGVLNGFAPVVLESIRAQGLWEALAWTFGISIVDVAAVAVGVHLARQSPRTPLTLRDYVAAALFALLILVPHRAMSWAAVTGLAVYELAGNRRSAPAVAAASVFILLAASVFWGRVLAQVFADTLLSWDAWLAAGFLDLLTGGGVERIANVIMTDHGSLVVSASCSSLRNVLYGLLCWLTIARALRHEWQRGDLIAAVIVSGTVVAANALRISLLGLSDESYERLHGVLGENVFNLGLLLFTATIAIYTSRHQVTRVAR